MFASLFLAIASVMSPYGVCAHVTRGEDAEKTFELASAAGIGWVRSDFDMYYCYKNGKFDFSFYDRIVEAAEAKGVRVLPILYIEPNGVDPVWERLDLWSGYVRELVKHFGERLPVLEIWNEPNIKSFWRFEPDVSKYLLVLKSAYETVKATNPAIQVSFAGVAGWDYEYIESALKLGAANYFDILSIHPYCYPYAPEGTSYDKCLDEDKRLLAKYGAAGKKIWITELGWPTHKLKVRGTEILPAGLKIACPGKRKWNAIYAVSCPNSVAPDQDVALAVQELLPEGSRVVALNPRATCERLAEGGIDLVIYPFDESYPSETLLPVMEFVKKGGVLVDFYASPMWDALREPEGGGAFAPDPDPSVRAHAVHKRLRMDETTWWLNGECPKEIQTYGTPAAKAAGLMEEPTGFTGLRFFTGKYLHEGDRMIPVLTGTYSNKVWNAAVVYKFGSDWKGSIYVSSTRAGGVGGITEEEQARYLVRSLGLAIAKGVQAYFPYEFQATEKNPYYSEAHFGIVHADYRPKPAYAAYRQFTRARPAGSVQRADAWYRKEKRFYCPQWTLADGRKGGMLWTVGSPFSAAVRVAGGKAVFCDMYGKPVEAECRSGEYLVKVTDSPVYFLAAENSKIEIK
jgi:hypothetical protein